MEKIFYHGTPDGSIGKLSPRKSRLNGIFLVEDRSVAEAYSNYSGRIFQTRIICLDSEILDASGTVENDNWHFPSVDEWKRFLDDSANRDLDVAGSVNYPVDEGKPLSWEAVLDPIDGLGHSPVLGDVLKSIGYKVVLTTDYSVEVIGDIYKRFGEKSSRKISDYLSGKHTVPIAVVLDDDVMKIV